MITSLLWPQQPIVYWHSRLKVDFFKSHLQVNFCCKVEDTKRRLQRTVKVKRFEAWRRCGWGLRSSGMCPRMFQRLKMETLRCLKGEGTCLYSDVSRLDILYFSSVVPSWCQNIFFFKLTFRCVTLTQLFQKQSKHNYFYYKISSAYIQGRYMFRPITSSSGEVIIKYTEGRQ